MALAKSENLCVHFIEGFLSVTALTHCNAVGGLSPNTKMLQTDELIPLKKGRTPICPVLHSLSQSNKSRVSIGQALLIK